MKRHTCTQCTSGCVPGEHKTFDPSCPRCLKKLASGQRSGQEPHPKAVHKATSRALLTNHVWRAR